MITTAPLVDNLEDLSKFIDLISLYKIPYSFIDKKQLEENKEDGNISENVYQKIINWKDENKISTRVGYLSDIFALLERLGIITKSKLDEDDLNQLFCETDLTLKDITNGKTSVTASLTDIGYDLNSLILNDSDESRIEYKSKLFWLILRSEMNPVWQRLIEKKEIFSTLPVSAAIKEIGLIDDHTGGRFLKWSKYFDLFDFGSIINAGEIFEKKKFALKLLYSTIFELNLSFISKEGYYVEELVNEISKKFQDLSNVSINFLNILETIFEMDGKENVEGSTMSKVTITLPNHPKVSILKIKSKISIFPKFRDIPNETLLSFGSEW